MRKNIYPLLSLVAVASMLLSILATPLQAVAAPAPVVAPAAIANPVETNQPTTMFTPSTEPLIPSASVFRQDHSTSTLSASSNITDTELIEPLQVRPSAAIALSPIGQYESGIFDESATEIVAHDPVSQVLYVSNAFSNTVDILDISTPTAPTKTDTMDMSPYGGGVNSVAFHSYGSGTSNGLLAVAVEADPKTDPGTVAVFDRSKTLVFSATVGALPDMVAFTPDGTKLVVANEGEPNDDYTIDPAGSVSIINMSLEGLPSTLYLPLVVKNATLTGSSSSVSNQQVSTTVVVSGVTTITADFTAYDGQEDTLRAQGIRIFGPGASASQDFEPEYIAVSPDSTEAYVTLQENNALAIVNLTAGQVTAVLPLGYKDHSLAGQGLDPSDRDDTSDRDDQLPSGVPTDPNEVRGEINIGTWPVNGMYQPDAIAAYESAGQVYLVTANEGDAREYEGTPGFVEEERIGDASITLDPAVFPNAATLKQDENLGRLTITTVNGNTDADADFEELYAFGARSFSVWSASTGGLVFDSGDQFEEITAAFDPTIFNNTNDEADGFDSRSDAKGPEPEGVDLGEINGQTYAFVGLERVGGIMVYDVTDPADPEFVQYVNTRSAWDNLGPEGILFIPAGESPTGQPMLAVSYEVSGSVTLFEISTNPDGAGSLTLLHNNDGESQIEPVTNSVPPGTGYLNTMTETLQVAGIAAYKSVLDNNIAEARQSGHAVLNLYAGDAFLASSALRCSLPVLTDTLVYDALAQRQMNYDAHALGNHEFDYSPDFLKRFIDEFTINGVLNQPFLSANLNFVGEPSFLSLLDADGLIQHYSTDGRTVARSAIIIDEVTGQRFGVVSAITPDLPTISTPRNVQVTTPDIASVAQVLQQEIDRLDNLGVKKIILVSHLQNLDVDRDQLIPLLSKVDIAVGGGGDEALFNSSIFGSVPLTDQRLPGDDTNGGDYPATATDSDGRTVYVVTTAGNYKYAGRLDVTFDDNGEVSSILDTSYPRRVIPNTPDNAAAIAAIGVTDAVAANSAISDTVVSPIQQCIEDFKTTVVASTDVVLNVARGSDSNFDGVRNSETNAGNTIADAFIYTYGKYAPTTPGVSGPDATTIALQNGGGIRQNAGDELPVGGVVPGDITLQNVFDVLPFDNLLTVVEDVTPADLKAILERSASGLPDAEGRFMQMSGITVTYNISNTAQVIQSDGTVTTPGQRVIEVTLADGTPIIQAGAVVGGAPNVTIVTNSFTANGGDNYPWLTDNPQTSLLDASALQINYDQAWREYLEDPGGLNGTVTAADYPVGGSGRINITTN